MATSLQRRIAVRSREAGRSLTPAQVYIDEIWASAMSSVQKIVALCYGNHARKGDLVGLTYARLMQQTGIANKRTIASAVTGLVKGGWLAAAGPAKGHKQVTAYRLALPETGGTSATGSSKTGGTFTETGGTSATEPVAVLPPNSLNTLSNSPADGGRSAAVSEQLAALRAQLPKGQPLSRLRSTA